MPYIRNLKLHNVRSYTHAALNEVQRGMVVLHGPNGAGKTNILEALSFLVPGRGLRSARAAEVQNAAIKAPWAVTASVDSEFGPVRIGTGLESPGGKRIVRINGETVKSQGGLSEYLACIWMTPQMDRLFLDSSRERRKFLDRMIFAFTPSHSGRLTRYDNALGQRSKLLKDGCKDDSWLGALEAQIAETGVSIAAARLDFVQRLDAVCETVASEAFPRAEIYITGMIEKMLQQYPALKVEDQFRDFLAQSRGQDSTAGGAADGPHKTDMDVYFAQKAIHASQCSTGEQKILLVAIILAYANLVTAERGAPPVLLLDEVAAHLDENRRHVLFETLQEINAQVWLTGTDRSLFDSLQNTAQFFAISEGKIRAERPPAVPVSLSAVK